MSAWHAVALVALVAVGLVAALAMRCHRLAGRLAAAEERLAVEAGQPAPRAESMDEYWYEEAMAARAAQHVLLDPVETRELRARGLADPVRDLRASLSTRASLLGLDAGPGGTDGSSWHFTPASIAPLNDRWVFARFDDGHRTGSCLLAYEVKSGGRVRWTLVDTALDPPAELALP